MQVADSKKQKTESIPAEFTTLPAVKAMVSQLQAVPQHTIPIADRKHILLRMKACLVEQADAFREAEFGTTAFARLPRAAS